MICLLHRSSTRTGSRGRCPAQSTALRRGALFVASAEHVPAVVHPDPPLQFPIHVGTVSQALQPPEVGGLPTHHTVFSSRLMPAGMA